MPKPLPMRQSASRRVIGCLSRCLIWWPVAGYLLPVTRYLLPVTRYPLPVSRLVDEEEFGRAQQHLQIPSQWRHRQHLLLVVLGRAAGLGHARHHALTHLGFRSRLRRLLLRSFAVLRILFLCVGEFSFFVGSQ